MIKNIFKNFLYKASGEPVIKIEKVDPQDSGIDVTAQDDRSSTINVHSSNERNEIDVIELISEDEDDLSQIVEINDDESSDITTSSEFTAVSEPENNNSKIKDNIILKHESSDVPTSSGLAVMSESEDNNSKIKDDITSTSKTKMSLDDQNNSIEEVSTSNKNISQGLVQQNSMDGMSNFFLTDNPLQKICGKDDTDCLKQDVKSSNQVGSPNSKNEDPKSTKALMDPIFKKKSLAKVSSCVKNISNVAVNASNLSPRFLLFNPHSKVSIPLNGMISSTPEKKKLGGTLVKLNYNKILFVTKNNNTQIVKPLLVAPEIVPAKINKNTNDKIMKIHMVILSTPTSLSGSKATAEIKNPKEPLIEENHTKTISSPTTHGNPAPATTPSRSLKEGNTASTSQTAAPEFKNPCTIPTTSFDKKNNTDNQTSTPMDSNSNSEKTVPQAEKSKTSSIGVQTDEDSAPKNLKRKAADDNSQSTTATFSQDQEAPPVKKQKTKSSDAVSDIIIRLDGKSANRIEISNELLENGQEQQVVSQFFDEISSVVIVQPPSTVQSIIKIINKSLRKTNEKSSTSAEITGTNCDSGILNNNHTSSDKESNKENLNNQEPVSNNESVNNNKESTNKDSNGNEKSINKNLNNRQPSNQPFISKGSDINSNLINENLNNSQPSNQPIINTRPDISSNRVNNNLNNSQSSNQPNINRRSDTNSNLINENLNNNQSSNQPIINEGSNISSNQINQNLNNSNLNANIKIQKNEPTVSSTSPSQNVKSEKNFSGSFSPSGYVQYGTRLLNRTDKICFTGEIDEKRRIAIENLGGQITNDPLEATVLVTDKFRRTFKFICAICRAIPIVSSQWINESIAKNDFVNSYDYILKDKEAERNFGFQLKESLMKAKKKQLLRDYTILITPGVNCPSANELKTITKLAGARALVRAPKLWGPKSMIISCEEDVPKVRKILEKKPQDILCPVVTVNFILTSLLQQDLQINTQNLKVEKNS